jgi:hypothetical protein
MAAAGSGTADRLNPIVATEPAGGKNKKIKISFDIAVTI